MGCSHGKCCGSHRKSEESDSGELSGVGPMSIHGKHILTDRTMEYVPVPSHNFHLEYSVLSQRGYYPDSPDKENQDSFCIRTQMQGNPNVHFFGVYDGHGPYGTECSNFVRDRLVEKLTNDPALLDAPVEAYNSAFLSTNEELHHSEVDDTMSGTTAITVLVVEDKLVVANVGDSRAVVAVKVGNRVLAEDLSSDQTPFRRDEYERVKLCGARVLSADQVEGLKDPEIQVWGDEESQGNDPPRLWVQNGMYPGTAFTRSIGDRTAESIGVIAEPEVTLVQITPNHMFFVVASDGVFEFLSSQAVVNMVASYSDPRDACAAIVGESYKLWLENEQRTDDITIIIVHVKDFSNAGANTVNGFSGHRSSNMVARNSSSSTSVICSSEVFRSTKSESLDSQFTRCTVSSNRSPALVVPSPEHCKATNQAEEMEFLMWP